MELGKAFKKMMIDKSVTQVSVAAKLGVKKQNFNNKLRFDNFRIEEIMKISDILGYDLKLQFIDRANGEIIEEAPTVYKLDSWALHIQALSGK